MSQEKQQIEQQLWNIANTLRGRMDADEADLFHSERHDFFGSPFLCTCKKIIWYISIVYTFVEIKIL